MSVLSMKMGRTVPKGGTPGTFGTGMLDEIAMKDVDPTIADKKRAAYELVADAMAEAEAEGIERDIVTQAALFAVLLDLVSTYGETAVAAMTERLPQRILSGDYTANRRLQ